MNRMTLACISALSLGLTGQAAHATLLSGQSIDGYSYALDAMGGSTTGATATVVAPGNIDIPGASLNALYTDNQIVIQEDVPNSSVFYSTNYFFLPHTPYVFNGVILKGTTGPLGITSVALDSTTTVAPTGFSFDANSISVDLRGKTLAFGDKIVLDLNLPSTGAVPEPASWAMMLVGFSGLGLMARSRRSQALTALVSFPAPSLIAGDRFGGGPSGAELIAARGGRSA